MRGRAEAWRLRICAGCGAMVALLTHQPPALCADCGGRYWNAPATAPWKLSASDQRLLRQLAIGR